MSYSSTVKSSTTDIFYAQINSDDPSTAISNSQGSTAQSTIPIVQGDKIQFRFYLTEYNYNTGVLTHGISLGSTGVLKGGIRKSDDATQLVANQTFTKVEESAEKKQSYFISFSKDINNLAGKYFTIGRRIGDASLELDSSLPTQTATSDTSSSSQFFTQNNPPVVDGDAIKFVYSGNGTNQAPFSTQQDFYYVRDRTSLNFKLAATVGGTALTPNSSGDNEYQLYKSYNRDDEVIDAFWFNDTGGTKTTTAPSIAYNATRIDINTTTAPSNVADYPSRKAALAIAEKQGFTQTSTSSYAQINSTSAGKVEHIATTSDSSNIGISVQQHGLDAVCYYEAVFDTTAQTAAINTALGTADSFTAKFVLFIEESSRIKTIAQQDVTIHRDFGS